ncbi:MAG: type II toxin-antitoxin system RelE/ParE family toxin [Candidatus Scalindua sp.]|nr:type II toxin-antitoxin system RelE/ParE family toxin [Candidatus Scalindua sp.]
MWRYEFSKESIKALEKLDLKTANLVKSKIKNLGSWLGNRDNLHADVKKLKGKWEGFYRLRMGKIRVLISFETSKELIKIHDIGFRGNVY